MYDKAIPRTASTSEQSKKHIKTPVTPLSYELQKYGAMHDDAFINANMWGVILSAVEEKKVWLFD